MPGKLKTFRSLSTQQKRLLLQAYRLLGTMRFAILTRSFRSLVTGLEVNREVVEQALLDAGDLAMAHQVGWAVRTAAQYTPWQSTCLVQVLAAQRMLLKRGIPGIFFLGASADSDEAENQTLSAHAWLKCNQEFITGEAGHHRYTVLSSFTWL